MIPELTVEMAGQLAKLAQAAREVTQAPLGKMKEMWGITDTVDILKKTLEMRVNTQVVGEMMDTAVAPLGQFSMIYQVAAFGQTISNVLMLVEAMMDKPLVECTVADVAHMLVRETTDDNFRREAIRRMAEKYQLAALLEEIDINDEIDKKVAAGLLDKEAVDMCRGCEDYVTCPASPYNGGQGHTSTEEGIHNLLDRMTRR